MDKFKRKLRIMIDWDDILTVEEMLCIELREGSIFISVIGIFYGFIGLLLILSFLINYDVWRELYDKKTDELIFLVSIFIMIAELLFTSFVLLIGILRTHESLIKFYLWSIILHIAIDWIITLCMCSYCIVVQGCFRNGVADVVVGLVLLAILYTVLWSYFVMVVNSYRMEM